MIGVELRQHLLADLQSGDDNACIAAALELLSLGEYGDPAGTYLLQGGKAALRTGRLAEAAVLLYQGTRMAAPRTLVWAELLVNRALVCCRFANFQSAIQDGLTFLAEVPSLPAEAGAWVPYAHHAVAQALDRLHQFDRAVPHHRSAAGGFSDPELQQTSLCNLAYSLARSGETSKAADVLARVAAADASRRLRFVYACSAVVVLFHLERYSDVLAEGRRAEQLAADREDELAVYLAEVHYWMSRATWALGDRYHSAALALHALVDAECKWNMQLRDQVADWLEDIMRQGGIRGA